MAMAISIRLHRGMETAIRIFSRTRARVRQRPAFASSKSNPYGLTDVGYLSRPSFADVDGDGDLDAFIGEFYGNDVFFREHGHEFVGPGVCGWSRIRTGSWMWASDSSPSFADLDGDGDLDAFIGERYGDTYFFENTGTSSSSPAFFSPCGSRVTNPFGLADVGGFSSPSFADLDGDGDLDAFIGEQYGNTYFFENIDTVSAKSSSRSRSGSKAPSIPRHTMTVRALGSTCPKPTPTSAPASVAADFFSRHPTGQQRRRLDLARTALRRSDHTPDDRRSRRPRCCSPMAPWWPATARVYGPSAVAPGSYYVVVGHRNHVAVMSGEPRSTARAAPAAWTCGLECGDSRLSGLGAWLADLGGVFGIARRGRTGDGQVQNDDKNVVWATQVGQSGYRSADFNLNAEVQNDDKNGLWLECRDVAMGCLRADFERGDGAAVRPGFACAKAAGAVLGSRGER